MRITETRRIFKGALLACLLACTGLCALQCAGASKINMVTYDQQLLNEAERAFSQKRYDEAIKVYTQIRDNWGKTQSARVAQYKLSLLHLFYDNPDADWKIALLEFKRFASLYPQDDRVGEVNSWIRILVAMESFEAQFELNSARVRALKNRHVAVNDNYDVLLDSQMRCMTEKDSLVQKVKKLEDFILKIEKTR